MILLIVFKDVDSKDDPGFQFTIDDDDNDDEMSAAMLPDSMTKPKTNLHCADSAVIVLEQPIAHATETCPNVTQGHAATSRVTTNARQFLSYVPITGTAVILSSPLSCM